MNFRTPLAYARGLGTAKNGTKHWWMQRVTSLALLPLIIWFVLAMLHYARAEYEIIHKWLTNPINSGLMVAFIVVGIYHAKLGMQVIYEDYVRPECAMYGYLLLTQFLLFILGTISIVSILKIACT